MRIFVGYGYNDRDKWVEDFVFPLIEAFGDTPVAGKEIFGQNLNDGVRGLIKECDALMGSQLGIGSGKSHIRYDEKERDRCLLALAQTISRWHSEMRVCVLQLAPEQFIKAIIPRIGDANLRCTFQLINANTGKESNAIATDIIQQKEGLFVYLKNVPSERFVRLRVSYGAKFLWASEYQKPDTRVISLKKQPIL